MPWVWQDNGTTGPTQGQPYQWPGANQGYNVWNPWSAIAGSNVPAWDMGAPWTGQQGQEKQSWLTNVYMPYQQMMMEQYQNQWQATENQRRFNLEQAAKEQQQMWQQETRWPEEQALHRGLANINVWGGWNAPNAYFL